MAWPRRPAAPHHQHPKASHSRLKGRQQATQASQEVDSQEHGACRERWRGWVSGWGARRRSRAQETIWSICRPDRCRRPISLPPPAQPAPPQTQHQPRLTYKAAHAVLQGNLWHVQGRQQRRGQSVPRQRLEQQRRSELQPAAWGGGASGSAGRVCHTCCHARPGCITPAAEARGRGSCLHSNCVIPRHSLAAFKPALQAESS